MSLRHSLLLVCLVTSGACSDSGGANELPPLGEVVLIVDTDASVPALVNRLRIDAFSPDGTWYASRDFLLDEPDQWPTSFGVYSANPGQGGTVTLRLRAYADGNVRDYLGERYQARPVGGPPSQLVPTPSPPPGAAPRLLAPDGSDITPTTEPEPLLAIDELVLVQVAPNVVESASVVLRGACFGTMADLQARETCAGVENTLVPLTSARLGTDLTLPTKSLQGNFGRAVTCTATPRGAHVGADGNPLYDEEVCVGGGTFVFGRYPDLSPERIVTVPPFLMDKYEVSVERFREALARGLTPSDTPIANDGPFPTFASYDTQAAANLCTFSVSPQGREDFPVSCIDWGDAHAFCQFEGGDLPSEVQWEWVISQAGRAEKTAYPWGGPNLACFPCSRGDFGRGYLNEGLSGPCLSDGLGPASVVDADHVGGDRSVGFGVVDLGFNLSEVLRDSYDDLDSRCWLEQPIVATTCDDPSSSFHTIRGGSWTQGASSAVYDDRGDIPSDAYATNAGFRCVREATP
jgi:formylglycine-generating enzyme required for sulfatase activity